MRPAWRRVWTSLAGAALLAATLVPARAADPVADFYAGKTLRILVGFGPGGGYDLYARTLGRYLGKYIPGEPAVVVQSMPGAGSLKVVNWLYNAAPRDGTVLATFARGIVFEPLLGHTEGTQFDAARFNWIGSISNEVSVCALNAASGIASFAECVGSRSGSARRAPAPIATSSQSCCATCLPCRCGSSPAIRAAPTWCWRWSATRSMGAAAGRGPAWSAATRRCSVRTTSW
jgi:hypothetical protein